MMQRVELTVWLMSQHVRFLSALVGEADLVWPRRANSVRTLLQTHETCPLPTMHGASAIRVFLDASPVESWLSGERKIRQHQARQLPYYMGLIEGELCPISHKV